MELLGEKIRQIRKSKGISQMTVADTCKIKQSSYANIESGKTQNITIEIGKGIAKALNVSFNELFEIEAPAVQDEKNQKFLVFNALETYESTEAFFASGIFNPDDPEDEKKFDEYRENLRKFKNGMYKNLVLVGFCTRSYNFPRHITQTKVS
jgi:transcriptional regulator with XRE-family HTH domain